MVKAKQNELVRFHFTVFNASDQPLTGQQSSLVTRLRYNGTVASESVTTAEIGSTGTYYATFTPLSLGEYDLEVDKTGISVDSRVIGEHYNVEAADLDDIVTEVNANEAKIDAMQGNVTDILADTSETQAKLPTNNIMGSSDKSDKDDEIDAIKAVTDLLPNGGALTDIDSGINNIEAKLPTNFIMGSSVQSDKDDEIDAIKAKTDNLPADPASQSAVESAIATSESNIRGSDSDDLKTISDQIDPLATEANATANKGEVIAEIDANEAKIDAIISTLSGHTDKMLRLLGLTHENVYVSYSYDAQSNNITQVHEAYDSKANAETHDGSTGLLYKWTLTVVPDAFGRPESHVKVLEP